MHPADFTPAREEARVDALVAAVRARGLDGPLWLLCPHEGRRAALLDHLARAGGGWIHPLDWHGLLDLMEHRLGLASRPLLPAIDRILVVESALEQAAAHDDALARALRGNALDVARAVVGVVDTLRLHDWDGALPPPAEGDRVARGHLAILAKVLVALTAHLAAVEATDLPERLAAVALAPPTHCLRGVVLWVEGTDRLSPRERLALDLATACGAAVSLPPWIDRPVDGLDPDAEAPTLLSALRSGAGRAGGVDGLALHSVADPAEEAELVAALVEAHLAQGGQAEDVAVSCGPASGAWARVARALDRWALPWSGGGALRVQQAPLWQVVRASLRLAWGGPDAVDLATVLAAPGSGIYGSDRDYLVAQLQRETPSTWPEVRAVLVAAMATEPDPAAAPELDAEMRAARREQALRRVGALLDAWEAAGPLGSCSVDERAERLPAVFAGAVAPLLDPESIARAVPDARTSAVWLAAAEAVHDAIELVTRRLKSAAHRERRLHDVERLLTDLEASFPVLRDAAPAARRDGVALFSDDAWRCDHPAVVIVTGFVRGRHPQLPPPALLLGAAERALLAATSPALAALPDEETLHALARRATLRLLASPRARLVLLAPRRDLGGERADVSLALRDLLDRLPPGATAEPPPLASSAPRARAARAIRALGRGDVEAAVAAGASVARDDLAWRDLFAARFRPDASFAVGGLVRALVRSRVHDAADLESLLTCHYRYLMTSLLGLRPPLLRRRPRLGESMRVRVGRDMLARLDAAVVASGEPSTAALTSMVDASVDEHAPWAARDDLRDERRALVTDCAELGERYLELRRALGPTEVIAPATEEARPMFAVGGDPVMVKVPTSSGLRVTAAGGETSAVLVQLTRARASGLAARRDLGLDVEGALLASGADVVLRLNLAHATVDAMSAEQSPASDAAVAAMAADAARSDLIHRAQLSLDDHAAASAARIAEALARVDGPDGEFAPLDAERAASLDKVRALPCAYCDARLGCRVGLAGGGA